MINTISELIEQLTTTDKSQFQNIINRLQLSGEELQSYESWDQSSYSRNCIYSTDDIEILLLCWNSGDITPVHNHGGQQCWVYQVDGSIEEELFTLDNNNDLTSMQTSILTPGVNTYMTGEKQYHRLKNHTEQRATTLHIYALPIRECQIYNDEDNCFNTKIMEYDTV